MIPKKDPEEFINTFGEYWYLREFDYLPEKLEYYPKNISFNFMLEARNGRFDIFKTKEEAVIASFQIRSARGMLEEQDYKRLINTLQTKNNQYI